jgi:hypothetical protein
MNDDELDIPTGYIRFEDEAMAVYLPDGVSVDVEWVEA